MHICIVDSAQCLNIYEVTLMEAGLQYPVDQLGVVAVHLHYRTQWRHLKRHDRVTCPSRGGPEWIYPQAFLPGPTPLW